MIIPTRVRVGRKTYAVNAPKHMTVPHSRGSVGYWSGRIDVATHCNHTGRKLTEKERTKTFWHEVVHAMLYDMDSKLHHNEGFVDALARRLADVIESARF